MKVKLFTHTDFDGIGCYIVAREKYGEENVDVEYCDYDNINDKVEAFYSGSGKWRYEKVYITDISINDEVAIIVDRYQKELEVKLIDHHKTALWLNQYSWANVEVGEGAQLNCGTSMFYKYLDISNDKMNHLVESVRRYDTWLWKTEYSDLEPKKWNDLLYIYGRDKFVEMFFKKNTFEFSDMDKAILKIEEKRIEDYINFKEKTMFVSGVEENIVGVLFAESNISILGNSLCERNPELDYVMILTLRGVDNSSISFRTIKDIDLSEVAKTYGGGGHPKASGAKLSEQQVLDIMKMCA